MNFFKHFSNYVKLTIGRSKKQMKNRLVRMKGKVGLIYLFFIIGMFLYSCFSSGIPLFYTENQKLRAEMYNEPRVVFTTYFYWYHGGDGTVWSQETIDLVETYQYPSCWTAPRAEDQLINGKHDYYSYHPPADAPQIDEYGNVVGDIKTGIMENITDWHAFDNQTWHEWELRNMIRAGIDCLLPVYWWNGVYHEWARDGLPYLVDAWTNLSEDLVTEADLREPTVYHSPDYGKELLPKIGMFFDTTCMKELYCWNLSVDYGIEEGLCFGSMSGPDLNDPYWRDQFWQRIEEFFTVFDEELLYTWHGGNIVWLYLADYLGNLGTSILDYCKTKFQEKFGRDLYFVGPRTWSETNIDGFCDWGSCCPGPFYPQSRGIPVGAVGPGFYNIGAIPGQKPVCHPRNVAEYKQKWMNLMDRGAVWIHVETWNELFEGTGVAYAQEYGYTWIDATREMADKFHEITSYNPLLHINPINLIIPIVGFIGICVWEFIYRKNSH
jgi:hypothetical protein